jgi:hypothetical protein
MASTSVVFPWSTWAMMAILRIVWVTITVFLLSGSATRGHRVGTQIRQFTAQCGTFYSISKADGSCRDSHFEALPRRRANDQGHFGTIANFI